MRVTARSLWVGFLALLGAVAVAISWSMTTAVQLQVTTRTSPT
jgi:TRAP-type C4-dicarboxylate transport system permease small subunit